MKAVRFDLGRNTERTFVVPDDIPQEDLWFTPVDFNAMKETSRSESREWRKVYSHLLNDTFEHPTRPDAQDYLTAFCLMQGGLYRRGLERQCNRQHGEQRSDLKDRTRYLVFETQRRLKLDAAAAVTAASRTGTTTTSMNKAHTKSCETTTTTTTTTTRPTTSTMEEQLAEVYMESCRHARVFAIRIAKADEIVALGNNLDCAARTQNLLQTSSQQQFKRRSSGLSLQSNDSLDSRMLLHRHYRLNHHHRSSSTSASSSSNSTSSSSGGGTTSSIHKPLYPQQNQVRKCPTSPLSMVPHHHHRHDQAYAAIA